jgi:hypothetical protein
MARPFLFLSPSSIALLGLRQGSDIYSPFGRTSMNFDVLDYARRHATGDKATGNLTANHGSSRDNNIVLTLNSGRMTVPDL